MMVSVIIPAYNADRTIGKCLAAVEAQTWPEVEVIVVDDGSTDGTAEIVRSFSRVQYIHQQNAGPAAARNRGAAASKGEWLAFTDSDCVPHADWVDQLMRWAAQDVAAVGGTYGIANPQSLLARIVHAEIQARHARLGSRVDFLGSFNVAYRQSVFESVGGFDESFSQASAEDNDLAYRIVDAGGQMAFTRMAVVDHYHPEKLWPYLKTQARHGYWRAKLNRKHKGRDGGDKYASRAELAAPQHFVATILALAIYGTFVELRGKEHEFGIYLGLFLVSAVYLVLSKLWMAYRICLSGDTLAALIYTPFALLRDPPRIFGYAVGYWHFYFQRPSTS